MLWQRREFGLRLSQLGLRHPRDKRQGEDGVFKAGVVDQPIGRDSSVIALARRTASNIAESDVPGLAAEMAYHSLFALFALLLLLAGLTAMADDILGINNMRDRLVESGRDVLPQNASSVFEAFLDDVVNSKGGGAVLFGLAGLVWSGSALVGSAMKGLNRIFKAEERRGMVRRRLLAMSLALGLGAILIGATILIVFRGAFADALHDTTGSRVASELAVAVLAWPLALALLGLAAAVLYWLGPDRDQSFRWVTPGAVLFALGWVVASIIASLYLQNAGPVNRTYGLITAVIATIVWLYWSNLLFLAGAVLNVQVEDIRTDDAPSSANAEQARKAQP
jgi:membrane protein